MEFQVCRFSWSTVKINRKAVKTGKQIHCARAVSNVWATDPGLEDPQLNQTRRLIAEAGQAMRTGQRMSSKSFKLSTQVQYPLTTLDHCSVVVPGCTAPIMSHKKVTTLPFTIGQ